eukprot:2968836-Ditylum_brightwellii.AAC.1
MSQPFKTILSSPKACFPQWIASSLLCTGTQYMTTMAHTFAAEFRMMLNGRGGNPGGHGTDEVERRALHCLCCGHPPTKAGGGDFAALVEDTIKTNQQQQLTGQRQESKEHVRWVYTRMLLQGKLPQTVRWVTGHDKGALLLPTNVNSKTGSLVSDVLLNKHPVPSQSSKEALQSYDKLPLFIDINVTVDTVKRVSARMQGAAGPGGVDSIAWQSLLLPAWAAYRAIVVGRLIAPDKCPGIRLVGIGKILFQMLGKYILAVCSEDITSVCSTHQLCSGLKAGIEGAVHTMREMWDNHGDKESWGILLINGGNTFNNVNWKAALAQIGAARIQGFCDEQGGRHTG